jgi:hypothetical protein
VFLPFNTSHIRSKPLAAETPTRSPRPLRRPASPGLRCLHGCQGYGVDEIIDQRTAGEFVYRPFQTLKHWADADDVRASLNCFVGGISGVQIGKNKYGGATCHRAAGAF